MPEDESISSLRQEVSGVRVAVGEIKGMLSQALTDHDRRITDQGTALQNLEKDHNDLNVAHQVLAVRVDRLSNQWLRVAQLMSPVIAGIAVLWSIFGN